MRVERAAVAATLCLTLVACWSRDERAVIRQRLDAFAEAVNKGGGSGLAGAATHAIGLANFFTEDVVITLGDGSAPIRGRDMLRSMAIRLQPRTSEYTLDFEDVNVQMGSDGESAEVDLTAEFIRREPGARQSMDAREFKLQMRRDDGEWKIASVEAIQTLK
jgi:ketosteroid isomerase-like protein